MYENWDSSQKRGEIASFVLQEDLHCLGAGGKSSWKERVAWNVISGEDHDEVMRRAEQGPLCTPLILRENTSPWFVVFCHHQFGGSERTGVVCYR